VLLALLAGSTALPRGLIMRVAPPSCRKPRRVVYAQVATRRWWRIVSMTSVRG
jgi:hypothetical protein